MSLSPPLAPPRTGDGRTAENFRTDEMFPRIERAVGAILAKGHVVAPVDVLVAMQRLSAAHLEDWRRGRVPYLERVIDCNLTRLSRLLRILHMHAHDLELARPATPPTTAMARGHGRRCGSRRRVIRSWRRPIHAISSDARARLRHPQRPGGRRAAGQNES